MLDLILCHIVLRDGHTQALTAHLNCRSRQPIHFVVGVFRPGGLVIFRILYPLENVCIYIITIFRHFSRGGGVPPPPRWKIQYKYLLGFSKERCQAFCERNIKRAQSSYCTGILWREGSFCRTTFGISLIISDTSKYGSLFLPCTPV